jgi:hypothetical protein
MMMISWACLVLVRRGSDTYDIMSRLYLMTPSFPKGFVLELWSMLLEAETLKVIMITFICNIWGVLFISALMFAKLKMLIGLCTHHLLSIQFLRSISIANLLGLALKIALSTSYLGTKYWLFRATTLVLLVKLSLSHLLLSFHCYRFY